MPLVVVFFFLFFFQAEDGIRDRTVTGVQTCALPISAPAPTVSAPPAAALAPEPLPVAAPEPLRVAAPHPVHVAAPGRVAAPEPARARSEERRVGKEGRARGWPDQYKKNIWGRWTPDG